MDTLQNVVVPIIYCIFAVIGSIGNGLVLYIMGTVVKSKSVTDVYVTNLAVADLLFVATLPFLATDLFWSDWIFGEVFCKLLGAITYINMYGSIFFLTAMGIDRWLAVVRAVKSRKTRTTRRAWINSSVVWVVCLVLAIFPLTCRTVKPFSNGRQRCTWEFPHEYMNLLNVYYYLSRTLIGFVIPLSIIIFCYASILGFMKKRSKTKGRKYKGISRITKMVALVIVCFVVTWLPSQVTNIIHFLKSLEVFEYCPETSGGDMNPTEVLMSDEEGSGMYDFRTAAPMWTSTESVFVDGTLEMTVSSRRYQRDLNPISDARMTTFSPYGAFEFNMTSTIKEIEVTESSAISCRRKMHQVHMIFVCLGFANSIMNPFIYAFFGSALRKKLARMFSLRKQNSRLRRTIMRTGTFTTFLRSTGGHNLEGEKPHHKRASKTSLLESGGARLRPTDNHPAVAYRRESYITARFAGNESTSRTASAWKQDNRNCAPEEKCLMNVAESGNVHIDSDPSTSEPSDQLFGGVWMG